jgi:hypothetical protein
VRAKSGLHKAILDQGCSEFRRQQQESTKASWKLTLNRLRVPRRLRQGEHQKTSLNQIVSMMLETYVLPWLFIE